MDRPCDALVRVAREMSCPNLVLIHEATFWADEHEHARQKRHSVRGESNGCTNSAVARSAAMVITVPRCSGPCPQTSAEAMAVGRQMRAWRTILTHFSQRRHTVPLTPALLKAPADATSEELPPGCGIVTEEDTYAECNTCVAFDGLQVTDNNIGRLPALLGAIEQVFSCCDAVGQPKEPKEPRPDPSAARLPVSLSAGDGGEAAGGGEDPEVDAAVDG